jgi:hypothetical protein
MAHDGHKIGMNFASMIHEEVHDMRTTHYPICRVLRFVGIGLMLAGLFGGPGTASASDVELVVSQNDWSAQFPWGVRPALSLYHSERQEMRVAMRAYPRQSRI